MRLGDILEWLAGATLTGAAWAAVTGRYALAAPLVAGAIFLGYQAQCYAHSTVSRPRVPRPRLPKPRAPRLRVVVEDQQKKAS